MGRELTFKKLRKQNVKRCNKVFHPLKGWSGSDWGTAMGGEMGEVVEEFLQLLTCLKSLDTLKKLKRTEDGTDKKNTPEDIVKRLAKELADVVCYTDLLAARFDIDLGKAVTVKFNEVSDKRGSKIKLLNKL
jgi:NTP pyrophosphatase (non-canonical NTP hydrolase)